MKKYELYIVQSLMYVDVNCIFRPTQRPRPNTVDDDNVSGHVIQLVMML